MKVDYSLVEIGVLSNNNFVAMEKLRGIFQAYFKAENAIYWKRNPPENNPKTPVPKSFNPEGPTFILFVQGEEKHDLKHLVGFWPNEKKITIYSQLVDKIITEGEIRNILGIT